MRSRLCYFYVWEDKLNFFTFDLKKWLLIGAVILVPLMVINMQRNDEGESLLVRPFGLVTGLVQKAYSGVSSGVRGTTALYFDLIDIKKENRLLLEKNAELRAQLGSMIELRLENQRLNGLLGFRQKSEMELLAAKVIGKDLLPEHNTITINRGTQHGVVKNMAALTVGGVVGYIFRTQALTSQLLLLTDRYAAIDAIVQRSRARGIVEGRSRESGRLKYLRRGDDVKVGDLVVTSGLDNVFPKGFPIASVTDVNKSRYGLSQDVELKPIVSPHTLEEVFIVLNARNQNYLPEEEPTDGDVDNQKPSDSPKGEAQNSQQEDVAL